MTSPAYTIGKDELLLITTLWSDGEIRLLETEVKQYKASEVQQLIDETVSPSCDVLDVEVYDLVKKSGQSIAEDFDVRTFQERYDDEWREQAKADAQAFRHVYNARRPSAGNLTHALQGVGAGL